MKTSTISFILLVLLCVTEAYQIQENLQRHRLHRAHAHKHLSHRRTEHSRHKSKTVSSMSRKKISKLMNKIKAETRLRARLMTAFSFGLKSGLAAPIFRIEPLMNAEENAAANPTGPITQAALAVYYKVTKTFNEVTKPATYTYAAADKDVTSDFTSSKASAINFDAVSTQILKQLNALEKAANKPITASVDNRDIQSTDTNDMKNLIEDFSIFKKQINKAKLILENIDRYQTHSNRVKKYIDTLDDQKTKAQITSYNSQAFQLFQINNNIDPLTGEPDQNYLDTFKSNMMRLLQEVQTQAQTNVQRYQGDFYRLFRNITKKKFSDALSRIEFVDEKIEIYSSIELPEFCYNIQTSSSFSCPTMYPERAGAQCFKRCPSKQVDSPCKQNTSDCRDGTSRKLTVRFERDFAGTCWETCFNQDGTPINNCRISMFRVYNSDDNDPALTFWQKYWTYAHVQKSEVFPIGKNDNDRIWNNDSRVNCQIGTQYKTSVLGIPTCKSFEPKTCATYGMVDCVGRVGKVLTFLKDTSCGSDRLTCNEKIVEMVFAVVKGLTKLAINFAVPGLGFMLNIIKVVTGLLEQLSSLIFGLYKIVMRFIDDQEKDENNAQIRTKLRMAAVQMALKHPEIKKPLNDWQEDMRVFRNAQIQSVQANRLWGKVKNVVSGLAPTSTATATPAQKASMYQRLRKFAGGVQKKLDTVKTAVTEKVTAVANLPVVAGITDTVGLADSTGSAVLDAMESISKINEDAENEDDKLLQVSSLKLKVLEMMGLKQDDNVDAVNELLDKLAVSKVLAGITMAQNFVSIFNKGPDFKQGKAATDFVKSSLEFADQFDPTGLSGMAAAFVQDSCISEQDVVDPYQNIVQSKQYSIDIRPVSTRTTAQQKWYARLQVNRNSINPTFTTLEVAKRGEVTLAAKTIVPSTPISFYKDGRTVYNRDTYTSMASCEAGEPDIPDFGSSGKGPGTCETWGLFTYKKCKAGMHNFGCCYCVTDDETSVTYTSELQAYQPFQFNALPGDEITVTLMRRVTISDAGFFSRLFSSSTPTAQDQAAVFKATIPVVPTTAQMGSKRKSTNHINEEDATYDVTQTLTFAAVGNAYEMQVQSIFLYQEPVIPL